MFGEVIVVSGGRIGACTVANAVGRAALTPDGIAEIGPTPTKYLIRPDLLEALLYGP